MHPESYEVGLGEIARFKCFTSDTGVRWFLRNQEVNGDNMVKYGRNNDKIFIRNVTLNDIGTYCCFGYIRDDRMSDQQIGTNIVSLDGFYISCARLILFGNS